MEIDSHKLIYSIAILVIAFLTRLIISGSLKRIRIKFEFQKSRIIAINKIITFLLYMTAITIIAFIWGVSDEQFLLFVSSFLTVLGIAFFAQWSILSNITAGVILFVNYPVKIGDTITIMEKDHDIVGEIKDIGAFFITLQTKKGAFISLPNSQILQKMIKYK